MKLGTRLFLTLVPTAATIMAVFALWALNQRQATVLAEARSETAAYATAVVHAVEYAYRAGNPQDVQEIIDEVGRQPKIYGILIYDMSGAATHVSDPLIAPSPAPDSLLRRALGGAPVEAQRELDNSRVYSVFRPVLGSGGAVRAVLEVTQPLDFVEREMARVGQRYFLNTVTLVLLLGGLSLWMVRRFVAQPMRHLVEAARALGRGVHSQRMPTTGGGELAELGNELNRMVGQLEQANATLREAEKMAAVGHLAAGIAHEIAAPLNVISGRAELVLGRSDLSDADRRNLRIIVDQIRRITKIVRNLLDFARPRQPRLVRVDLAAIIDDVAEFLEVEFRNAGIAIERHDPRPCPASGDAELLHQVFANLFLNSVQAMDGARGERRIVVRGFQEGARSVIEVADTGSGIPEGSEAAIFEPFFTTKRQGTGLGLVVARAIVEAHGGTIEARRGPTGVGSVFRLAFVQTTRVEAIHA